MHCVHSHNVNGAFDKGWELLHHRGELESSRNGPVLVAPGPVTTIYTEPRERVLFFPARDANPFLHFFESLWMLDGRNDVAFLDEFTKNFRQFSDDGETLSGAYGYRWAYGKDGRGSDQIQKVVHILREDPSSRRAVITMWERGDLWDQKSKDIPCNLSVAFRIRRGFLDMTVFNRSNDMIWGAYGANVVHMSFLQELVATCLGVRIGRYTQVSNNFHIYTELAAYKKILESGDRSIYHNRYGVSSEDRVLLSPPVISVDDGEEPFMFENDLNAFFSGYDILGIRQVDIAYHTRFFREVVAPMSAAYHMYKKGEGAGAAELLSSRKPYDWLVAGCEWLNRRGGI